MSLDQFDPLNRPSPAGRRPQPARSARSPRYEDEYDEEPPVRSVKQSARQPAQYDDYDEAPLARSVKQASRPVQYEDYDDQPPPRSSRQSARPSAQTARPVNRSSPRYDDDSTSDEAPEPVRQAAKPTKPVNRAPPRRPADDYDEDYDDRPPVRTTQSNTQSARSTHSRSPVDDPPVRQSNARRVQYDDEDDVADDYGRQPRRSAAAQYDTGPLPPGARVVRRTVIEETEEVDEDDEFEDNPRPKAKKQTTRREPKHVDSDDDVGEPRGRRLDGTVKNTSNWAIKFAQTKSSMGLNKNCVQWSFESNGEIHKVELFHSTFGGKRTIKVDGIIKVSEKKLVDNGSKYHADLPDGSLLAIEIKPVGVSGNDYQLYIDNRDYDNAKRYWLTHDDKPVKAAGRKTRELRR